MRKLIPFLLLILTVSVLCQAFGATAPAAAGDATVLPVLPSWWDKFQSALVLVMALGRIAAGWKSGGFGGIVNALVSGGGGDAPKSK